MDQHEDRTSQGAAASMASQGSQPEPPPMSSPQGRKFHLLGSLAVLAILVLPTAAALFLFFTLKDRSQGPYLAPHVFNIAVFSLTCVMFLILRDPYQWVKRVIVKSPRYNCDQPRAEFIRPTLGLLVFRSLGELIIHGWLIYQVIWNGQRDSLQWSLGLVLLGDALAIVYFWAWLTMFRAAADGTVMQMLVAYLAVFAADLFLFYEYPHSQYQHVELLPSAVLNALILGVAAGASAYRYLRTLLTIAFTIYSLTKVPAYQHAMFNEPGPERWIYYALGLCDLVIAVLVCDLFLRTARQRKDTKPILASLNFEQTVAVIALLIVLIDHWELLKSRALFLSLTIAVPFLAVILAFRGRRNLRDQK